MNGTVHSIIGVSTGAAVILTASNRLPVLESSVIAPTVFMLATTTGSIFPDLDLPGRPLGFLGHRGFTHTLTIPAICIVLSQIIPSGHVFDVLKAFFLGFGFAWLMHIFADLFQKRGVPLFWPFLPMKVHIHLFNMPVKYDKVFLMVYCAFLIFICSRVGFETLHTKILTSSPSIIIAICISVFILKKYFGKAWKETKRRR